MSEGIGGWKKEGCGKPPERQPSQKGVWTPLVRYVFHPFQVSVLCLSCTRIHDRADQKLFGGVQKFSGERVLWYVFLPPYVVHPPHIKGQMFTKFMRISIQNRLQ